MSRVVAYVRVSTEHQDVENQLFEIKRFAATRNIVITEQVEETVSGFKTHMSKRKISGVLDSLQRGDTLIVSEISRISRRLVDVMNTIQRCLDEGINIIAVKENFVFEDNINSKVMAFAFGLAAEIERTLISARTKEALARRKAEGVVLGRPKGSSKPENLKLYGKDEEILHLLEKRVPKAAIARMFDTNVETLRRYINRQELHKELLWRLYQKTGN